MGALFTGGQCVPGTSTANIHIAIGPGSISFEFESSQGGANIEVLLLRRHSALPVLRPVFWYLRKGGRFHNRLLLSDQYHQIQRWNPTPDWHPGHVHYFWLCHVQETTFGQHNTEQHSGGRDICEAGHEVGLPQNTVVQLSHILGHAAVQRHLLVCELQPAGQCHHIALICDFHNFRPAAHQYQPDGLQVSLHHGLGQEPV